MKGLVLLLVVVVMVSLMVGSTLGGLHEREKERRRLWREFKQTCEVLDEIDVYHHGTKGPYYTYDKDKKLLTLHPRQRQVPFMLTWAVFMAGLLILMGACWLLEKLQTHTVRVKTRPAVVKTRPRVVVSHPFRSPFKNPFEDSKRQQEIRYRELQDRLNEIRAEQEQQRLMQEMELEELEGRLQDLEDERM